MSIAIHRTYLLFPLIQLIVHEGFVALIWKTSRFQVTYALHYVQEKKACGVVDDSCFNTGSLIGY